VQSRLGGNSLHREGPSGHGHLIRIIARTDVQVELIWPAVQIIDIDDELHA
jgi:hypothetical protein